MLFILNSLLLICALSLDAFAAALAYGADKTKIPVFSAAIITLICTAALSAALYFGAAIKNIIPEFISVAACCIILACIGSIKIASSVYSNKNSALCTPFAAPKTLSARQAALLALALSLDGLTAGLGVGATQNGLLWLVNFSLILTAVFIYAGSYLGLKLSVCRVNLAWLSGAILIALSLSKLI
ncbi:MAG: manganese efflux pump [Firmicutes bacterium]|nr:manganese efflux pump [Bacillota bacterium]